MQWAIPVHDLILVGLEKFKCDDKSVDLSFLYYHYFIYSASYFIYFFILEINFSVESYSTPKLFVYIFLILFINFPILILFCLDETGVLAIIFLLF